MSLMSLTAVELGKEIKAKKVTVREAVMAALDQIESLDGTYNSYVTVDREGALKRADEVQKLIDAGELDSPLAGVPVAIKDNMCTKDMLTTCSSKILGNFYPAYTAEAVINLEKAGAVIIGKTNMDEFAMGSTTETSAYGVTRNPWNENHVPGGSSGGSCAAVAAEECSYALGSDTGGSIRQPSSFCGVTGIKPTYGTVSRYGLIAYGSSLDQIGPVAKDVTDCATILETIASYDPKDSTSVKREDYDFTSALKDDVKGMRIGIPKTYLGEGLDHEVKEAVLAAAKVLEEKGALVEEFGRGCRRVVEYHGIAVGKARRLAFGAVCRHGGKVGRGANVPYVRRSPRPSQRVFGFFRHPAEHYVVDVILRRIVVVSYVQAHGIVFHVFQFVGLLHPSFLVSLVRIALVPVQLVVAQQYGHLHPVVLVARRAVDVERYGLVHVGHVASVYAVRQFKLNECVP